MPKLHVQYALFNDLNALTQEVRSEPWPAFVRRFTAPVRYDSKKAQPLISLATYAQPLSGCIRSQQNLQRITGVEGDHDAGTVQPEEAARRLKRAGIRGIVVTTARHTKKHPRWHVFVPASKPLEPKERAGLAKKLDAALKGCLQAESFKLSQSWYVGRINGAPYAALPVAGKPIDLAPEPVAPAAAKGKGGVAAAFKGKPRQKAYDDTLESAAAQLMRLDNSVAGQCDWNVWNTVLCALRHKFGEEAWGLFDAWSQENPKYDEARTKAEWKKWKADGDGSGKPALRKARAARR